MTKRRRKRKTTTRRMMTRKRTRWWYRHWLQEISDIFDSSTFSFNFRRRNRPPTQHSTHIKSKAQHAPHTQLKWSMYSAQWIDSSQTVLCLSHELPTVWLPISLAKSITGPQGVCDITAEFFSTSTIRRFTSLWKERLKIEHRKEIGRLNYENISAKRERERGGGRKWENREKERLRE